MNFLRTTFILFLFNVAYGQWEDFNPGISGDFKDIEIYTDTKYICGNTGIYESDDYITWELSDETATPEDLEIMERSHFYGLCYYTPGGSARAMACGFDTVANQGVVMENIGGVWSVEHTEPGIKFMDIENEGGSVYVVGEMGTILVRAYGLGPWVDYSYPTDRTLFSLFIESDDDVMIVGDSIVLRAETEFGWDSIHYHKMYTAEKHSNYYFGAEDDRIRIFNTSTESWSYENRAIMPFEPNVLRTYYFRRLVGGENGIYKGSAIGAYEFFPSSEGYSINEIVLASGDEIYAVGDGGAMLKTTNAGGDVIPYAGFLSPYTACVDSIQEFENLGYYSNDYEWYVDGVLESTDEDFTYTFSTLGLHTVRLVADNGVYRDSTDKVVEVVSPPSTDLTFETEDTILCKEGISYFTIYDSEAGVNYSVYEVSTGDRSYYVTGTGGDIEVPSALIENTGDYSIVAVRGLSGCESFFADTVHILVEETKASFHVSHINAQLSSPVNLINLSEEATLFDWTIFTPDVFSSVEENLTHYYTDLGQYNIRLISESEYGCIDTLIKPGPFIYDTASLADNCWINRIGGPYGGGYDHDRARNVEADGEGNIFMCGTYNRATYTSQEGAQPESDGFGAYLAKYDKFGVLQWRFECDQTESVLHSLPSNYSLPGDFLDLEISDEGNIYVSGWFRQGAVFKLNDGYPFQIPGYEGGDGYYGEPGVIFKLDSIGQLIWHAESKHIVTSLSVGEDEILYAGQTGRYHNITGGDGSEESEPYMGEIDYFYYIMQFDSVGHINWVTKTAQHTGKSYDITVDNDLNLNVLGAHDGLAEEYIYSVDELPYPIDWASSTESFVMQYDSSGNFVWIAEEYGGLTHTGSEIKVDEDNNIYTQIEGGSTYPGFVFIKDVSGEIVSKDVGRMILVKYSQEGNLLWASGTTYGTLGSATMTLRGEHLYSCIRLSMGTDFVDSCYFRHAIPTDSMAVPIVDDINKNNFLFTKWNLDGEPQWYSYRNGPELGIYQAINSPGRELAVDDEGNVIFASSMHVLGDDFPSLRIAQREITPLYQDAILTKFSPNMCLNTISLASAPPCEGGEVEVAFDFHVVDETNEYSLLLLDDPIEPADVDTIGTLESDMAEGIITGTTPVLSPGTYYLQVVASMPELSSVIIEMEIFDDVPIATVFDTTVCAGSPVYYSAGDAFSYSWAPTEGVDSPDEQNITLTPDVSTVYIGTLTNGCGTNYDTVTVNLYPTYSIQLDTLNICSGDSILVFDNFETEAGTYIDSLVTLEGCDSILTQYLHVYDLPITASDTLYFCENDSVFLYGSYQNEAGLYFDTLTTVTGCDSVISTVLISNPVFETILPAVTICENDSILIFDQYKSSPGVYHDTLLTLGGCDSVLTISLMNFPVYEIALPDISICSGDSTFIFGDYRTSEGIYRDSLLSSDGCDSILIQTLNLYDLPEVEFLELDGEVICLGEGTISLVGTPSGGVFFGTGVIGTEFNPLIAGEGEHTLFYRYEDDNGCSATDSAQVEVVDCLGLTENAENNIRIYPNPFSDFTTIYFGKELIENHTIVIYDVLGKEVYRNEHVTGSNLKIQKEELGTGIYMLTLFSKNSEKLFTTKLLVKSK